MVKDRITPGIFARLFFWRAPVTIIRRANPEATAIWHAWASDECDRVFTEIDELHAEADASAAVIRMCFAADALRRADARTSVRLATRRELRGEPGKRGWMSRPGRLAA